MFEFTFVQKLMLLGLGSSYLWFFMWIWRSGPTNWQPGRFSLRFKKQKESPSNLGYTPENGYFDRIQDTKKKVAGGWFGRKRS